MQVIDGVSSPESSPEFSKRKRCELKSDDDSISSDLDSASSANRIQEECETAALGSYSGVGLLKDGEGSDSSDSDDLRRRSETERASEGSQQSNDIHLNASKQNIFVAQEVKIVAITTEDGRTHYKVKARFMINDDQRPDTKLGSSQGDHVLSYLSILYSIIKSTDEYNIENSINLLNRLSEFMLDDEGQKEYRGVPYPIVHDTEERKVIIRALTTLMSLISTRPDLLVQGLDGKFTSRDSKVLTSELVDRMNAELKQSKLTEMCIYICRLSNCILNNYNKQYLATCFSKGRLNKSSREGTDTKIAMRGLLFLNAIFKISSQCDELRPPQADASTGSFEIQNKESAATSNKDDIDISINQFMQKLTSCPRGGSEESHIMRYGCNKWNAISPVFDNGEALLSDLRGARNCDGRIEIIINYRRKFLDDTDIAEKIGKLVGSLLDYDRVLQFNVAEAMGLKNTKIEETDIISFFMGLRSKAKFSSNHSLAIDNDKEKVLITRCELNDLYIIIRRTWSIVETILADVFSYGYNGSLIHKNTQIYFLEEIVLRVCGWCEHKIDDIIEGGTRLLSLEDLKEGLQERDQWCQDASDTADSQLHL